MDCQMGQKKGERQSPFSFFNFHFTSMRSIYRCRGKCAARHKRKINDQRAALSTLWGMCLPAKFALCWPSLVTTEPVSRVIWPKPVELIKASLGKVVFQKILKSKMFRQKWSQKVLSIVQLNSAQLFSQVRIKELSHHLLVRQSESLSTHKKTANKTGSTICQFPAN